MSNYKISGLQFNSMLQNGLTNLSINEEQLNDLNVFPVPDGDTGTNMKMTLKHGLDSAKPVIDIGAYLKTFTNGTLLGARGNSGVILSEFFRGFFIELSHRRYFGPLELKNSLITAYKTAYKAVVKPVEGTILTVAREGIENVKSHINRNTSIENVLSMYIAEMRKSLSFTPETLSVLKESGVIDSGALGLIVIFEGMLKYLYSEVIKSSDNTIILTEQEKDTSSFTENSVFDDGYCLEFILQLMNSQKYDQKFNVDRFIEDLKLYGTSIVCVQNRKRVKVHIHTLHVSKIIALCENYGVFIDFKLENMQIQHNKKVNQNKNIEKKQLAKVSVVNGNGLKKIYNELGSDITIKANNNMSVSVEQFINEFNNVLAETIVILPNNPNLILAAKQAASMYNKANVIVIESKNFAQGYFALAMDIQDSNDIEYRINQMNEGVSSTQAIEQATASKDYSFHEISCKKGDEIALIDNQLSCVEKNQISCIINALHLIHNIEDKESCVIFKGMNAQESLEDLLVEEIEKNFPLLEVSSVIGDQETYNWIVGIS